MNSIPATLYLILTIITYGIACYISYGNINKNKGLKTITYALSISSAILFVFFLHGLLNSEYIAVGELLFYAFSLGGFIFIIFSPILAFEGKKKHGNKD